MKTYKLDDLGIPQNIRIEFSRLRRRYQIEKMNFDDYVLLVILPILGIDYKKGKTDYSLEKGELYFEEHREPQSQDKPGEGGDTKTTPSGNV